ncbi:MAG: response regulator [Planctomycetota bacterium]
MGVGIGASTIAAGGNNVIEERGGPGWVQGGVPSRSIDGAMENDPGTPSRHPGHRHSRILLIEDDDLDVIAFHKAIAQRELPIELQRARNAIEAREMLHLQLEDGREESILIVLDLNMPALNGIEFLRELRADPQLRSSVVFAYTTSESAADMQAAYEANVAGYFTKDVLEDSTAKLIDFLAIYLASVRLPRPGAAAASGA